MTDNSLVSVIIPTYYRNDWLREAIESALSQSHDPLEIIVVDDSGEEYARPVCAEYDIKYLSHDENKGGNPARNTGIRAATGDYIQLLDDDDRLLPSKIAKQLAVFDSNPDVGVVYCGLQQQNGVRVSPDPSVKGDVLEQALRINDLHPCQTTTMLFRSELITELEPLATREAGDDLGLKIRASSRTKFDYVDEILVEKGDSKDHRAAKLEFSDEVWSIIDEFDHLYERFDDNVRKDAIVVAYQSRGRRLMHQSYWSKEAIMCFARAFYHSEPKRIELLGSLLSSIFGRKAYRMSSKLYGSIQ